MQRHRKDKRQEEWAIKGEMRGEEEKEKELWKNTEWVIAEKKESNLRSRSLAKQRLSLVASWSQLGGG
jgi:hypothetical protein